MAKRRNNLSELSNTLFISPSPIETILIHHEHIDLPYFASFITLKTDSGREWFKNYQRQFLDMAQQYRTGIVLGSPTWRCSPDWIEKLNYSHEDLIYFNKISIELLEQVRNEYSTNEYPILINAIMGPRGDGYNPKELMTIEQAQQYHSKQIEILSQTNVDLLTAGTINYSNEAIGIVRAAQQMNMPIAISFTFEHDGNLISGQSLKEAIETVDEQTNNGPICYFVNCVHPVHVLQTLEKQPGEWTKRIHGIYGNASKKTHEELDKLTEVDDGNPVEFAQNLNKLLFQLPNLNFLGGCCGTDVRHIEQICQQTLPIFNQCKTERT